MLMNNKNHYYNGNSVYYLHLESKVLESKLNNVFKREHIYVHIISNSIFLSKFKKLVILFYFFVNIIQGNTVDSLQNEVDN